MIFGGAMTLLEGISAIAKDTVILTTRNYVFSFSLAGWGWIHLILGIVILAAGVALIASGATWARVLGVILAGLGALANFLWIPYYPFWALTLVAIDIFIIWALCAGDHRHPVT
ncbi:DUF7144 family membrane protein [Streptomyces endophytica]|uniref:DUF7144 domain-containing protein n=1 Tax=Streptomyces endophytica TaxID=2991496 RepID=A0ABY6PF43_9ACTN|nr:hypothetical protein [Streptomyces endophytica]UZJ32483.1 hypothetical protein OJ254_22145 [Streptomyces endophytica]